MSAAPRAGSPTWPQNGPVRSRCRPCGPGIPGTLAGVLLRALGGLYVLRHDTGFGECEVHDTRAHPCRDEAGRRLVLLLPTGGTERVYACTAHAAPLAVLAARSRIQAAAYPYRSE